jgi:hypothetical protein
MLMKKIIMLLTFLSMSFALFSKGNLYAIFVIDNEVTNVDCSESLFDWQDRMNVIHHYTGMKTQERVFAVGLSGATEEWSRDVVLAAIDDVKPDEQDTVLFFFAGQSVKNTESDTTDKKKSRYPEMLLQHATTLQMEEVAGVLAAKRPGLVSVFADFYDNAGKQDSEEKSVPRANRSVVYSNYRKLFNDKRHAAILAASCSAGKMGENGVFTKRFFHALDECTALANVSWKDVLEKMSEPAGVLRNKACWEIRAQKDFTQDVSIITQKIDLPEWTALWDENWYDDREWYDDGGWSGEVYENDEEYYAEDEILIGEDDE